MSRLSTPVQVLEEEAQAEGVFLDQPDDLVERSTSLHVKARSAVGQLQ